MFGAGFRTLVAVLAATIVMVVTLGSSTIAHGNSEPGQEAKAAQEPGSPGYLGELTKSLVDTPLAVTIPAAKGKVTRSIEKKHRTYPLTAGGARVLLAKLPVFTTPYVLTIRSICDCLGFSKSILVPVGVFLDSQFQPTRELSEADLWAKSSGGWEIIATLEIGTSRKSDAYLLLYPSRAGGPVGPLAAGPGRMVLDERLVLVPERIALPASRADHGKFVFETSLPVARK